MIKTEQFLKACGCRSAGECTHNSFAEFEALDAMVDAFAAAMKSKLRRKAVAGYHGWDNTHARWVIVQGLLDHFDRGIEKDAAYNERRWTGDPTDIANLAAMLWNMEQP